MIKCLNKIIENQFFNNRYNGELSELSVGLSAVHQNKFYLGLGLNFVDLNFVQQSALTEQNRDTAQTQHRCLQYEWYIAYAHQPVHQK